MVSLIRQFFVGIFGWLDEIVYQLISMIYNLLITIAEATIFDENFFSEFASRVYVLLGLFMLFKVSFSLVKYIVNPDEFNDKVKGGKKLITNVLVVLILIVVTPMGFQLMRTVQKTLLEEHVIENLILGVGAPVDKENIGKQTAMAIFSSFYRPEDENCAKALFTNDEKTIDENCGETFDDLSVAHAYGYYYSLNDIKNLIKYEPNGVAIYMAKNRAGTDYSINYMFLISTIVGVITALIFLNFCIDIAIRTVKLGFLELIAPIPIISYIDPNSAKNGMFSKWIKEVGKTFADLFVRLAAVYFALTLISAVIGNSDFGTNSFLARVFIIIGILIFAKQVPQLIGDLFGFKVDGNFSLNPMSKINSSPFAAAAVGGVVGLGAGAASNLWAAGRDWREKADVLTDENDPNSRLGYWGALTGGNKGAAAAGSILKNMVGGTSSVLAGGGSAMLRGGAGGLKAKGSAINAGLAGATTSSRMRNARDGGYNIRDKMMDRATDIAGLRKMTGTTKELEDKIKANQQQISNYKRDEQSFSQQLADISRDNPLQYHKAFESTIETDEHGNVLRDKNGRIISNRKYSDYNTYVMKEIDYDQARIDTDVAALQQSLGVSEEEALKEFCRLNAESHGLITEQQYNDYEAVMKERDKADDEARKLEKRNKELQGYLDARSGKPKE